MEPSGTEGGDRLDASVGHSWARIVPLGAALLATVAFFHRAVFTSDVFIDRDIFRVYYPLRHYWAQRVGAGEFPLWFPYDGLGQPFVGMVISGAFHPSNLLYLVFPLGLALKLNLLACYPVAFLGAHALARRLGCGLAARAVGGMADAFCGYFTGLTNNLLYLMAAATLPWVVWAADRALEAPSARRVALTAILHALILLAGDAQCFAVTSGMLVVVAIARHRRSRGRIEALVIGSALVMGWLLGAVQLFPALEALGAGSAGVREYQNAVTWSFHPLQVFEVILGSIFGGTPASTTSMAIADDLLRQGLGGFWVESLHLGVPVLFLAGIGALVNRTRRPFWALGGASILVFVLVMGRYGGLYRLMFEWIPLWRPFRYPMKLFPFVLLALALAAAAGAEAVFRDRRIAKRAGLALVVIGLVCLTAAGLERLVGPFSRGLVPLFWEGIPSSEALGRLSGTFVRACLQSAAAAFVAAAIVAIPRGREGGRGFLLPAVIGLHFLVANEPLVRLGIKELIENPTAFIDAIHQQEGEPKLGEYRVVAAINALHVPPLADFDWSGRLSAAIAMSMAADSQVLWGLEGANNYLPATSGRYVQLCRQSDLWLHRYASMFSTRYVALQAETFEKIGGSSEVVFADDRGFRLVLLRNPRALPRAYLARPKCVDDGAAALGAISGPAPVASAEAVVECLEPLTVAPTGSELGRVAVTSYLPERVELEVEALTDAVLVLNDAFYPGWTATVDGRPTPILAANYAVRAVPVARGSHRLEFRYRSEGLIFGAVTTAFAIIGCVLALLWRRAPG